jgi:hypothetical protein
MNAESVEQLLVQYAMDGRDISYSEALEALGLKFSRPKMRVLCRLLGEVDRRARENGEPELAVLVVRANDRLPGEGWWNGRTKYRGPRTGEQAAKYIKRLQGIVFRYWKSADSIKSQRFASDSSHTSSHQS